jgi:hypothetical protein
MKYPAIWIAKEGSMGVTDEPMTSCSWIGYKNGFFRDLLFYDSGGEVWRAEEVILKRTPSFLDRILNRKLHFELRISGPEKPRINDIADQLCNNVDNNSDDIYNQFVEHDKLKYLFRSAETPEKLIHFVKTLGSEMEEDESV